MSGPFSYQVVTDWSFREKTPLEELQERGEEKKNSSCMQVPKNLR